MPNSPVTFHVLHYAKGNRWAGFRQFALFQQRASKIPGVRFAKVMGCGRGPVFSVRPDWGRYAFLFHWESAEVAKDLFASAQWQRLESSAESALHWHLSPLHSKGLWDGKPRFEPSGSVVSGEENPLFAVITRADLKPWRLRSFGAFARKATDALNRHSGVRYTLGMGELPFVRQATFSVWDGSEAMKSYAYRDADHKAAMKGKKTHGWYGEEMYARFAVVRQWEGKAEELILG